jgi:dUTP pyrophosphatase
MKVFRLNKKAERPKFSNRADPIFNMKACLEPNTKVSILNSLNKETFALTKVVNGKTVIQVYPQQRLLIPTGLAFEVEAESVLKIYTHEEASFKKGLILVNGISLIKHGNSEECHVMIYNISDAVTVIEHGENIAQATLEKIIPFDITEIPTEAVTQTSET